MGSDNACCTSGWSKPNLYISIRECNNGFIVDGRSTNVAKTTREIVKIISGEIKRHDLSVKQFKKDFKKSKKVKSR